MTERFIHEAFIHIGDKTTQKNISSGLTKVLEMDEIIHHAYAWSPDKKSIYIISKQRASQAHNEKAHKLTAGGEKPLLKECFVMARPFPGSQPSAKFKLSRNTLVQLKSLKKLKSFTCLARTPLGFKSSYDRIKLCSWSFFSSCLILCFNTEFTFVLTSASSSSMTNFPSFTSFNSNSKSSTRLGNSLTCCLKYRFLHSSILSASCAGV